VLTFKVDNTEVSTNDFIQASFEVIYDRIQNRYINRFMGYAPADKAVEISNLLIANLDSEIDVVYGENYSLLGGKVIFVNADIVNNQCRVEIEKITNF